MEAEKIVFDLVDTVSSPVIIVEENDDKKYSLSYMNKVMDELLKQESTDKAESVELPETLQMLLLKYSKETELDSYLMHDVDIFDKCYNIAFNKKDKKILILFNESKPENLFNDITFHDLSQACNAIIVVLDEKGSIVDMNDCFLELVGMKKESVLKKNLFESFIPGDKEQLDGYFKDILQNDDHHQHFVTPLKGKDDTYRINWQVSKIVKNKHTYIIAVGSDISKFINENSALKKQLKSIKIGFDYFPFAVGYMNGEGRFTKVNPRFMKIFHIHKDDKDVTFNKIPVLKNGIDFDDMNKHIKLIKDMSYKVEYKTKEKTKYLKVDIRLLTGSKETTKFYIVVVQKI